MPQYKHHIFVCENVRDASDPKGSCGAKGGTEIREAFKDEVKKRGLKGTVRANKAGCLDQCSQGAAVVVYPEAIWYGHVTLGDVQEIMDSHIEGGVPVERLRI